MILKHVVTLLFLSILSGCAASGDPTGGGSEPADRPRSNCIMESSIRGYSVLDESNLIIDGPGRRQYHMVLMRRASGIRSSWAIGFRSTTGRICPGFDEIVFRDGSFADTIRIDSIRELNQGEYEQLMIEFGKMEPEIETQPVPEDVKGAEIEELDPAAAD